MKVELDLGRTSFPIRSVRAVCIEVHVVGGAEGNLDRLDERGETGPECVGAVGEPKVGPKVLNGTMPR